MRRVPVAGALRLIVAAGAAVPYFALWVGSPELLVGADKG